MYKRPNSENMLAAPAATGGLKGIIAGNIKKLKVKRYFLRIYFIFKVVSLVVLRFVLHILPSLLKLNFS